MAGETVQITNELLYFVQNKSDVMLYEMVVKLTSDFHDNEQIERAKDIIFNKLENIVSPNDERKLRNRTHIGADKKMKNMEDLLNIYLMLPPLCQFFFKKSI